MSVGVAVLDDVVFPERGMPRWLCDSLALIVAADAPGRFGVRVVERRASRGVIELADLPGRRGGFVYPLEGELSVLAGDRPAPVPHGTFTYCPPAPNHAIGVTSTDARFLFIAADRWHGGSVVEPVSRADRG